MRKVTDVNTMETEKPMNEMVDDYYELLKVEEDAKNKLKKLRPQMERVLSLANRDSYGLAEHDSPLIITFKMENTAERMKKGDKKTGKKSGKEILQEILTTEQWSMVYNKPGEKAQLRIKRKDKGKSIR